MIGNKTLVMVAYYLRSDLEYIELLSAFIKEINICFDHIIVVENHALDQSNSDRSFSVNGVPSISIPGSNIGWEFSGWIKGIRYANKWTERPGVCVLINDSYQRNWNITAASRKLIRSMPILAAEGCATIWMDVMDWSIFPPRIVRKANSRLTVIPNELLNTFCCELEAMIDKARFMSGKPDSFFSSQDQQALDRYFRLHVGRWNPSELRDRYQRVFIEHSIPSLFKKKEIRLVPKHNFGSIIYRIIRLFTKERR